MSSSSSRPTYTSLDAFRGFAALWVVMDHGGLETIATRYPQLRHQPLFAFSTLGMLGVQIFFVISGFCIANAAASAAQRGKGTIAFAVARLRRIYPPYFFAALLTVSLSLLASFLVNHHYLRASRMAEANLLGHPPVWYFAQVTLTQVPLRQEPLMNVFWTLCYEVAFYAVVTAVLRGVRSAASPVHRLLQTLHAITVASAVLLAIAPGSPS